MIHIDNITVTTTNTQIPLPEALYTVLLNLTDTAIDISTDAGGAAIVTLGQYGYLKKFNASDRFYAVAAAATVLTILSDEHDIDLDVDTEGVAALIAALVANTAALLIPDIGQVRYAPAAPALLQGLNDITFSIPVAYTGTGPHVYEVAVVAAAPSPDTFKWRVDGGAWSAPIGMVVAGQVLSLGVWVFFGVFDGHTVNDSWAVTINV
jgi:hypothetical protein